jgi:tRNA1(Val) A37 N6-methylase TrmN6
VTSAAETSPDSREDALLDGRVRLRQPVHGYRVAIDPVLLAAAAPVRPGEAVLDLGCGVGAAALCLLARVPAVTVTGLELQPALARLARDNASLNGQAARLAVAVGDLRRPPLPSPGPFDHVICNPPYQRAGAGRPPADPVARVANVEVRGTLADWLAAARALVRPRGTLSVIHRADRLDELLAALSGRAGAIVVKPIRPRAGADARRVIVAARPGVATPLRLADDLILHDGDRETPAARAVLREAAALPLSP